VVANINGRRHRNWRISAGNLYNYIKLKRMAPSFASLAGAKKLLLVKNVTG